MQTAGGVAMRENHDAAKERERTDRGVFEPVVKHSVPQLDRHEGKKAKAGERTDRGVFEPVRGHSVPALEAGDTMKRPAS